MNIVWILIGDIRESEFMDDSSKPLSAKKPRRMPETAPFRESLHDSLTEQLRGMIIRHELEPGEWIQEMELCQTLGVSRTPMREALKVLAAEKLVTLYPYRGASVTAIDPAMVEDLFEVQSIIESQAGMLACIRASDAAIVEFARKHAQMVRHFRDGERVEYFALNQDLHRSIVFMAGNDSLIEVHAAVMKQIERARYLALDAERRWEVSMAQHVDIHDALVARKTAVIGELMRHHILDTSKAIVSGVTRALAQRRTVPPAGG
ncbi:MAG: GntR family transcriptional regulator [Hyphomicrobiales bacterium]|nr:MAG: GntR family transcriptional regulator [Hyphomicrobiales bacterium]